MNHNTESQETEQPESKSSGNGAHAEQRLLKAQDAKESPRGVDGEKALLQTAQTLDKTGADTPDRNAADGRLDKKESDGRTSRGDRFEQFKRSLGIDRAEVSSRIDRQLMNEALTYFDPIAINDILVQFDSTVDDGNISKAGAAQEATELLQDMIQARNVPGLADSTTSVVELLRDTDVFSSEWHGYRFEIRYAAEHADGIKQVDCSNYVDVQMKDGTYRELKSFQHYNSTALRNALTQLEKDIDPDTRGLGQVEFVFDRTYENPTDAFMQKFLEQAQELQGKHGWKAQVTCVRA